MIDVMRLVIFDLDGTLIDSATDIALSVNELRQKLALPSLPLDQIQGYIGNGVRRLLDRALEDSDERTRASAFENYLPIYRRRLLDNTVPFDGVLPALDALEARGRTMAVLTNKPVYESSLILDGLGLSRYFDRVYGGDSFERRKPDPVGVRTLLTELDIVPGDTLFVGDSVVDYECARHAEVRFCLVTYGIERNRGSMTPDHTVDDLRELEGVAW